MLIRLIPVALLLLFESSAFAGQWTRLSPEVLSFEGIIEEKTELKKLVENWDDRIKKLIVNSPGGNTVTGILMGNFLADKKFGFSALYLQNLFTEAYKRHNTPCFTGAVIFIFHVNLIKLWNLCPLFKVMNMFR